MQYIIAIDQSTMLTKALLVDKFGGIIGRSDIAHEQKTNELGWVSHNPEEIFENTIEAVRRLLKDTAVPLEAVSGVGISNQRETALIWERGGSAIGDAVVWQCARSHEICQRIADKADFIKARTGLPISPFFSASKLAWLLENRTETGQDLLAGTMDSWLVYRLTNGKSHCTDYSNASRTQLFDIHTLSWDSELCEIFGVDINMLPKVCGSDSFFGATDFGGILPKPVPIHSVMGDSHAALYGQGCNKAGMMKATYGTGSSVMMNTGSTPIISNNGLATSLAWGMNGGVEYVLEGNINYSGATIKWLVEDLGLISSPKDAGRLAAAANPNDSTYLVPAFSGLGAPWWSPQAKAMLCGISRTTRAPEIVRAAEECIAYQVADVVAAMCGEAGFSPPELRVDGGATHDSFLMQFQSDILKLPLSVPSSDELSALGVAYAAGIALGVASEDIGSGLSRKIYSPTMPEEVRGAKYSGWRNAVRSVIGHAESCDVVN